MMPPKHMRGWMGLALSLAVLTNPACLIKTRTVQELDAAQGGQHVGGNMAASGQSGGRGPSGGPKGGNGGTAGRQDDAQGGSAGEGNAQGGSAGEGNAQGGSAGEGNAQGGNGGEAGVYHCPTDVYAQRARGTQVIPVDANGNITIGRLSADTVWRLEGRCFVQPGQTLTIDPCTLIEASRKPNAGALFVPQGAKIHAVGAKDAPIVFTNETHSFDPDAIWGGVVLLGKAPVARVDESPDYLRLCDGVIDDRARFGAASPSDFDQDDSSGEVAFVRIEYGGDIISDNREFNGITLCGVGAGTTVDHIMVRDQMDDCFEWLGGTVTADHLICQNPGDDMFDIDAGFRGRLQFLLGRTLRQGTSSDPNGFEWDGNQDDLLAPDNEMSMPMVSNATLCGLNAPGVASDAGAVLRRNLATGTSLMNVILSGWEYGVDYRNHVGTNSAPTISWTDSLFFSQRLANGQGPADDDSDPLDAANGSLRADYGFIENDYFSDPTNNVDLEDIDAPSGFDCYSDTPQAGDRVEGGVPPDPLDSSATFIGAGNLEAHGWNNGTWIDWGR